MILTEQSFVYQATSLRGPRAFRILFYHFIKISNSSNSPGLFVSLAWLWRGQMTMRRSFLQRRAIIIARVKKVIVGLVSAWYQHHQHNVPILCWASPK